MKKIYLVLVFLLISLIISIFFPEKRVSASQEEDLKNQINEYQQKVIELQKQVDSLGKQISIMDSQIKITNLKINQSVGQISTLETEVASLSGKIIRLDGSLDYLSKVLLERVKETYKNGKVDLISILFSSKNISDFISRYRYLQIVQIHDRDLLLSMEQTRTSYTEQKELKEKKQTELTLLKNQLVAQKSQLAVQSSDKKKLLDDTKGQEANYQKLLASARSELEAITGILEGKGSEKEIKKVSEGERIATLIPGQSCNSSGTHLHFIVYKDDQTFNPLNFLKNVDYQNCSGSSCGSTDGDPFNPSGNWNWPLNPKIKFNQGYGNTWAVQHTWVGRIYSSHNGIDLQSDSLEAKAVKSGTLYWGSYVGNCLLKYVKVHHDEDGYDTYYLHINY